MIRPLLPGQRGQPGAALVRALCASLLVALEATSAVGQTAPPMVGRVVDTAGKAIIGVELSVLGTGLRASTDELGAFRLSLPFAGSTLVARRLGFRPETLHVAAGAQLREVRMTPTARALDEVVVRVDRMRYTGRLASYYERLEGRSGGQFITREEIDLINPRDLSTMMRRLPGIEVMRGRGGAGSTVRFRGKSCAPLVWLDGVAMAAGEVDLDTFTPKSIQGIEIYLGATTAPSRYQWVRGRSSCGTILLWSRGPDTEPPRDDGTAAAQLAALVSSLQVFTTQEVDSVATLVGGPLQVAYPSGLYAAGVTGRAVVEVVVDTLGRPEDETFGVVSATHQTFAEAVRQALPGARFRPAVRGGRKVRQVVVLPVTFELPADRLKRR